MHVFPASLVGFALWVAALAAAPSIYTVLCGPLFVSGVALLLALIA